MTTPDTPERREEKHFLSDNPVADSYRQMLVMAEKNATFWEQRHDMVKAEWLADVARLRAAEARAEQTEVGVRDGCVQCGAKAGTFAWRYGWVCKDGCAPPRRAPARVSRALRAATDAVVCHMVREVSHRDGVPGRWVVKADSTCESIARDAALAWLGAHSDDDLRIMGNLSSAQVEMLVAALRRALADRGDDAAP